jgi:hypothetical protein
MYSSFSAFAPFIYPPGVNSVANTSQYELTKKHFPKIHFGANFGELIPPHQISWGNPVLQAESKI